MTCSSLSSHPLSRWTFRAYGNWWWWWLCCGWAGLAHYCLIRATVVPRWAFQVEQTAVYCAASLCLLRSSPTASLVSACIGIYSPNCLALWVSQPSSISLILCLYQNTGRSSCWVSSAWGLYNCCSMLGCLRTNQKHPGLPFLMFLILLYRFW